MGCRSNHTVTGERRFYTGTNALRIDGEQMTRPGSKDNVWVHDQETDQYVLRDSDGTEHARFDSAEEIFTDADAYPDGGERTIMPPVIPEHSLLATCLLYRSAMGRAGVSEASFRRVTG